MVRSVIHLSLVYKAFEDLIFMTGHMELEKFIEKALTDVCNGIAKAKDKLNTTNSIIAPGRIEGKIQDEPILIEFEVLVTINENNALQVEGGLNIAKLVKAGGKANKLNASENKSRIRFSVPYLPQGIPPKPNL